MFPWSHYCEISGDIILLIQLLMPSYLPKFKKRECDKVTKPSLCVHSLCGSLTDTDDDGGRGGPHWCTEDISLLSNFVTSPYKEK